MKPIDDSSLPPAPKGTNVDYLTQDIMSALERATLALVERTAVRCKIGQRQAAMAVLHDLENR